MPRIRSEKVWIARAAIADRTLPVEGLITDDKVVDPLLRDIRAFSGPATRSEPVAEDLRNLNNRLE